MLFVNFYFSQVLQIIFRPKGIMYNPFDFRGLFRIKNDDEILFWDLDLHEK
jgi:hypothetical protein